MRNFLLSNLGSPKITKTLSLFLLSIHERPKTYKSNKEYNLVKVSLTK